MVKLFQVPRDWWLSYKTTNHENIPLPPTINHAMDSIYWSKNIFLIEWVPPNHTILKQIKGFHFINEKTRHRGKRHEEPRVKQWILEPGLLCGLLASSLQAFDSWARLSSFWPQRFYSGSMASYERTLVSWKRNVSPSLPSAKRNLNSSGFE